MPTVAELAVTITADTRGFDAGVKHVETESKGLGSSLSSGIGMGAGFGAVGAAISLVGSAFSAAKGSVIDLNGSLEQSSIAFTTMLGSAEKSEAFLGDLQKFAAATPFEFPDLVSASKRMLAFGFESKQVVPLLTAVGDAVAAVGGGAETIDGVTTAIGQMQAKGKVSAEEMGQLAERGIPAWDMLAKQMGVSVAEAMDAVSKGQVKAGVFIEAFQKGSAERFGGMMEKQALTWSGALSTITDSLSMATAKAFQPFFKLISEGAIALAAFLQSDAFTAWASAAADAITDAVGAIRALLDALRPLVAFLAGPWDDAAASALAGLEAAFGPEVAAMVADMARLAGEALGALASFITQEFGALFAWWDQNWPRISVAVQAVLLGMALFWKEHGAAIETIVRALWTIVSTIIDLGLKQILNLITLALQVLTLDWEGAWETLGTILKTTWDAYVTILGAAWDVIFALLDTATGGALTKITDWLKAIDAAVVAAGRDLRAVFDGIWNGAAGIVAVLTTAWDAATTATDHALNAAGSGIVALATTGWGLVSTATTDAFNGAGSGVVAVVGTGWELVSTATTDAFNAAGAGIVAVVGVGWGLVSTATTDAFNAAGSGVVAVATAGWGLVVAATDLAFGAGTGATLTGLVQAGWASVIAITTSLLSGDTASALAAVRAGWDAVIAATTSILGSPQSGLEAAVAAPWNAVVGWLKGLAQSGSDLVSAALSIGTAIVDGLQQGISGALGGLKSWVTEHLTNALPAWVRSALGISSPSTVFAEIGAEVVAGLIAGLDRGRGDLLKKATELATKLVGSFDDLGDLGGLDNLLKAALSYTGHPESWIGGLKWIIGHESGGDPSKKNPESTASGLFQLIDTTWAAYRDKKLPNDVFNPFANVVAGINYIDRRYDDPASAIAFWKANNWYGSGGIVGLHGPEIVGVGERGPEAIVPLSRFGRSGGGLSEQTVRIDVAIGGRLAEEIYVTGRDLAIRRGRAPTAGLP